MVPARAIVYLSQNPSTESRAFRVSILDLAWIESDLQYWGTHGGVVYTLVAISYKRPAVTLQATPRLSFASTARGTVALKG